jgi:ribonuclease P protein component
MIGRLVQSADFQRLLATPSRSRSAHFAVHHVASAPIAPARRAVHLSSTDLSTDADGNGKAPVDIVPDGHWLGSVVPKRHARRSVTRNLLRRQIRAVMAEHLASLPAGLWLVRLRVPFDRGHFVSAASAALREAARVELQQVFGRAAQPAAAGRRQA